LLGSLIETKLEKQEGCWTKLMSIQDINPEDIHGHIFMLALDNRPGAYEYREGLSLEMGMSSS
jgi:hypothetical protein